MEAFTTLLTEQLGPFGPLLVIGILGLFLILLTAPVLLKKQKDPLDRLRAGNTVVTKGDKKASLRFGGGKGDRLDRYKNFLEPKDEEELSAIRLKLIQAGYRGKTAVQTFYFAQFALGLIFLVIGVVYAILQSTNGEPSTTTILLSVMIPAGIGYFLPKYWITKRQQERQEQIQNGFPDSLDMMLVCVEAGQSLDQAIIRVSKEIRAGFPDLADEYEMVANEIKAGKDKTAVLRDMSERAGVADVASFVTVLIQSQQFGTSIAEALRVYAAEMRDKRVMRAEEKANTLPTKMTLATMVLTVPPLLIILVGPSVYSIVTLLSENSF